MTSHIWLCGQKCIFGSWHGGVGRANSLVDVVVLFLRDHTVNTDYAPFRGHNYMSFLIPRVHNVEDLMNLISHNEWLVRGNSRAEVHGSMTIVICIHLTVNYPTTMEQGGRELHIVQLPNLFYVSIE